MGNACRHRACGRRLRRLPISAAGEHTAWRLVRSPSRNIFCAAAVGCCFWPVHDRLDAIFVLPRHSFHHPEGARRYLQPVGARHCLALFWQMTLCTRATQCVAPKERNAGPPARRFEPLQMKHQRVWHVTQ
jgi:hypothetical protein